VVLKLSSDDSRITWDWPFWAKKEGIVFSQVRSVSKGVEPQLLAKARQAGSRGQHSITIVTAARAYRMIATNEHARDKLHRYLAEGGK
jgi:hypothetical protein